VHEAETDRRQPVKFVNYTTYTHDQQALTELRPRHVECTGTAVREFERLT
jgi:hypothetical protein